MLESPCVCLSVQLIICLKAWFCSLISFMIWRCSPQPNNIERKFKSINRHFFTMNLLINLNLINLFFNFSLLTVYSKNKIIERSRVDQEKFFRGRGVLKFLNKGPILYRGWWGYKICIQTYSKNSNILKSVKKAVIQPRKGGVKKLLMY